MFYKKKQITKYFTRLFIGTWQDTLWPDDWTAVTKVTIVNVYLLHSLVFISSI